MTFSAFCKIALGVLLSVSSDASRAADADLDIIGKLIAVRPQPACGIVYFGSPATYDVVAGPAHLQGKQVTVVVPCIELPLPKGDLRAFQVGDVHALSISKKNLYKIGVPSSLHDDSWFYLRAASLKDAK